MNPSIRTVSTSALPPKKFISSYVRYTPTVTEREPTEKEALRAKNRYFRDVIIKLFDRHPLETFELSFHPYHIKDGRFKEELVVESDGLLYAYDNANERIGDRVDARKYMQYDWEETYKGMVDKLNEAAAAKAQSDYIQAQVEALEYQVATIPLSHVQNAIEVECVQPLYFL
ncbi:hypothetical protein AaE_012848 [Aphanomyces astaci]|uniref:Uncharacterized protein n=1 Tax=Aphanomyces astaci TaxID=112090 RepID=A0A6A4ZPL0_APHAT|nr:hypothetical protein AaE_012848 [Aphanomyces astaci]